MAPAKYRQGTEFEKYDSEDQDDDCPNVLVPYDLNTTSLAMHVACFRFVARYERTGRLYGIESERVSDGYDTQ